MRERVYWGGRIGKIWEGKLAEMFSDDGKATRTKE